jgi:O-antigen ligase
VNLALRNKIPYYIAIVCIMAIFFGMLYARALSSIALVVFCVNGLLGINAFAQFKLLLKKPWYICSWAVVGIVAISGLWSSNLHNWQHMLFVKLPLIILPIGFFALAPATKKNMVHISLAFIGLIVTGTIYSMLLFIQHKQAVIDAYQYAKVLPTPFDGNHIYFSYCIAICLLWLYTIRSYLTKPYLLIGVTICACWLIMYLHILAAKTGLLMFYVSATIVIIHKLCTKASRKKALAGLVIVCMLPIMAWFVLPTFKTRLHYIVYDITQYNKHNYIEGLSDGSRLRSIKVGAAVFFANTLYGTGYGDVSDAMHEHYMHMNPVPKDYEQMDPSSQLMVYAVGCGVLGLIILIIFIGIPFTEGKQYGDITWYTLATCIALFLLYEVALDGQYGVFLICFFLLWWRQYYSCKH